MDDDTRRMLRRSQLEAGMPVLATLDDLVIIAWRPRVRFSHHARSVLRMLAETTGRGAASRRYVAEVLRHLTDSVGAMRHADRIGRAE